MRGGPKHLAPAPLSEILALTLECGEISLFFHVIVTYKQSRGFGFEAVNGPALMHLATRSLSAPFCQALKKSACMVDPGGSPGWSEESVTAPVVVGTGYWKFVWSRGTGYGWLGGHSANPPLLGTGSVMCER
jgi:hypothetical protein